MRRPRGPGGRFLSAAELAALANQEPAPEGAEPSQEQASTPLAENK